MDLLDLAAWPDRLEALVERIGGPLRTGRVIAECDSTQDLARAMGLGSVVVAGRQVAGRGQRGNRWADTAGDGLAFSMALPATDQPECSLALAHALVASLPSEVEASVKPPNDVLVKDRKLAGVLVEQADGLAVIGIGINVHQEAWSDDLEPIAISLRQVGCTLERLEVLECVLPGLVEAWNRYTG
jgi:BirA family biotin operon repressor/biotin-[acetyl-CoA-carboxylase] ligase